MRLLNTFTAPVLLAGLLATGVCAHDLWVNASESGTSLTAELGYGHDFPVAEAIAEDRVHIFPPMKVFGSGESVEMIQEGENYRYVLPEGVAPGTYYVAATYRPTYWTRNPAGWRQATKRDVLGALYCSQAQMFGKRLLIAGDAVLDETQMTSPVGHQLELIPHTAVPYSSDQSIEIVVLFNGEPLAAAEAEIFFRKGEGELESRKIKADPSGRLALVPGSAGEFLIKVSHKEDYPDKRVCDYHTYAATLTFSIH